ncbi:MAG TPA: hypothetical protein VGL22_06120 [Terracidiphilus sp.]
MRPTDWPQYLAHYYAIYSLASLALVLALLHILHRAGALFLRDCCGSNPTLARAIRRLLDLGYLLVCAGYFVLTVQTSMPMNRIARPD